MNPVMNFAEGAFKLVAQTTWQATVVAGLILLAQWLFRKQLTPAWRHGLWFLLVARLLMPASFPSALSIFNLAKVEAPTLQRHLVQPTPPVSTVSHPLATMSRPDPEFPIATYAEIAVQRAIEPDHPQVAAETQVHEPSRRPPDWLAVAVLLWLSGVFIFGLRLIWSNLRFSSRLAQHPRIEDEPIVRLFDDCVRALGLRRRVTLIETGEVESPAVYGLWHKRVLLPEGFSERFSGSELRCVFMHELAHLKRYDLEINWLVSVLQVLHWFNPALWFAFARMRADRELACDTLVMLRMDDEKRLAYGETILKLLESLTRPSAVPGLLGISEDKRRMKQRISVIANFKRPTRWSAAALLLVVGLGIVGLTDAQTTKTQKSISSLGNTTNLNSTASKDGARVSYPITESSVKTNPLPKILRDWEKRRKDIGLITYRFSGAQTWLRGSFTRVVPQSTANLIDENPPWGKDSPEQRQPTTNLPAENPPHDVTGKVSSTVTLDFKNNRCRVEKEVDYYNNLSQLLENIKAIEIGKEGVASVHILAGISPNPSKPKVDFLITRGSLKLIPSSSFHDVYFWPLFFASGVVPTKRQHVKTVNIGPENDASAFRFEGYRTERGRRFAVLRVDYSKYYDQTSRYWVDLEHDSAIVKFTTELRGSYGTICNIEYGSTAGFWLPQRWTTTNFHDGRTNNTVTIAVTETALPTKIASDRFVLKPLPGMHVEEVELNRDPLTRELVVQKSYYRLHADGSKGEQSSEREAMRIQDN